MSDNVLTSLPEMLGPLPLPRVQPVVVTVVVVTAAVMLTSGLLLLPNTLITCLAASV